MKTGLALLGACVLAEVAVLGIGIDDLDEGYFAQQALRVVHGQVPFRDFQSLYTPGLVVLHAALFGWLGGPSLPALRVAAMLARVSLVLALYAVTLPLVRRPLLACAPGVFLLVALDDAPVRWEPHPGWLSALFAALTAVCLMRPRSHRWLIAAGAAAALAYAFKQNAGGFMLAAVILWAMWPARQRAGQVSLVLATFGSVTLVWLTPLLVVLGGDLGQLGPLVGAVEQAGLFSPPEVGMLVPIACAGGGLWLIRRAHDPRLVWLLVAAIALFLTQYPRMDTAHLVWSTPLLLAVGAVVLDRLRPPLALAALLAGTALAMPTLAARLTYLAQPRAAVARVAAPAQTAADLVATVAEITTRTHPGEPIFVYPSSPLLYVLADRPNPTRFDHLNPGAANAAQIQATIALLESGSVTLAVVSDFWRMAWGPPGLNTPLESWLDAHFVEAARHGPYRVLVSRL